MTNIKDKSVLVEKTSENSWFEVMASAEELKKYRKEELITIKNFEDIYLADFLSRAPTATQENIFKIFEEFYIRKEMIDEVPSSSEVVNEAERAEGSDNELVYPSQDNQKDDKSLLGLAAGAAAGLGALAYTQGGSNTGSPSSSSGSNSSSGKGGSSKGESSKSDSSENDADNGQQDESKNANGACAVCDPDECLVDIEINDLNSGINYFLNDKEAVTIEGNKQLSDRLIFAPIEGKSALNINYTVSGDCTCGGVSDHGLDCVSTVIGEFYEVNEDGFKIADAKVSNGLSNFNKNYNHSLRGYLKPKASEGSDSASKDEESDIFSGEVEFIPKNNLTAESDFLPFIRGINFLLFGKLNYLPVNQYEFVALSCNGKGDIIPKHMTNMYVLPNYEVSFEGSWALSVRDKNSESDTESSSKIEIAYEEKIAENDKFEVKFKFEQVQKEVLAMDDELEEDDFLKTLVKLINALDDMGAFKVSVKSAWQKAKERFHPPLFRFGLLAPTLEVSAKAILESRDGQAIVNRKRKEVIEPDHLGEAKPISPSGSINTPNGGETEANRDIEEQKIAGQISYIRFNPLIGGVVAVNLIGVITKIPGLGPVVGGLCGLFDFDLFADLQPEALRFDDIQGRKDRLDAEKSAVFSIKGFLFASADLTFSPAFLFHDSPMEERGTGLRLDGSFGMGFAAGAFAGVNVYVFKASAQIQASYGARFHFSFDYIQNEVRIWHDGVGFTSAAEVQAGVGKKENGNENRPVFGVSVKQEASTQDANNEDQLFKAGRASAGIGSGGASATGEVDIVEFNPESDFVYEPTTYENPSWRYIFGSEVDNEIVDPLAGALAKDVEQLIRDYHSGAFKPEFGGYIVMQEIKDDFEKKYQEHFRVLADNKAGEKILTNEEMTAIATALEQMLNPLNHQLAKDGIVELEGMSKEQLDQYYEYRTHPDNLADAISVVLKNTNFNGFLKINKDNPF